MGEKYIHCSRSWLCHCAILFWRRHGGEREICIYRVERKKADLVDINIKLQAFSVGGLTFFVAIGGGFATVQ